MPRLSCLKDLEDLYARQGGRKYGEGVTQLEHALQCANLAEASGAPPSLIAAALLHDVGHFLGPDAVAVRDDRHEASGAHLLGGLFGGAVCAPIALHVAAKRYLCFREAGYFHALSPASRRSLTLQGGPFTAAEADAFEHEPCWREALALRRFDDMGKRDDAPPRRFADFAPILRSLLIDDAGA